MRAWMGLLLLPLLIACQDSPDSSAGTNDETHTQVQAMLVLPDGQTPAAGATVTVTAREAVTATTIGHVDSVGLPVVVGLADGTYSVVVSKGSLTYWADSLKASGGQLQWYGRDTLQAAATLSGTVAVEPQDDPSTVTVNVLGTEIWTNVAHDGSFTLSGIGTGLLRLRFQTTLSGYTTTYATTRLWTAGSADTMDTVHMIYTGIPVAVGLSVRNDSATGNLRLSWAKSGYGQLMDYVIYRDTAGSLSYSNSVFASTTDTAWRDTTASRRYSTASWRYRVAVRTRMGSLGSWFGSATGTSVPPWLCHLDSLTWTEVLRGATGNLGLLGMRLSLATRHEGGDSTRLGVRTSSNELQWDSLTLSLRSLASGQTIAWATGIGAGHLWAFGHSLLGDGLYFSRSDSGSRWDSTGALPDSLWLSKADSLRLEGSASLVALVANGSPAFFLWSRDGISWTRQGLSGTFLGLDDSGFFTDGGGLHVLRSAWDGAISDLGLWSDSASVGRAVRWQGRTLVLAAGRLWQRESGLWSLRQSGALRNIEVVSGKLYAQDSAGRLWRASLSP